MISGTIWQWMMDADSGVINNFLKILYLFLDYPHKYYVFKYFEV